MILRFSKRITYGERMLASGPAGSIPPWLQAIEQRTPDTRQERRKRERERQREAKRQGGGQ